jgi:hypothetical protein
MDLPSCQPVRHERTSFNNTRPLLQQLLNRVTVEINMKTTLQPWQAWKNCSNHETGSSGLPPGATAGLTMTLPCEAASSSFQCLAASCGWDRFHKPIWLTEFACPQKNSVNDQLHYMRSLLPRLEAASYVYRYAWFVSRTHGDGWIYPAANLLDMNGPHLTTLGHYYNKPWNGI